VGNVTTGLARYTTYCATCHGASVKANKFNVIGAATVSGLNSAISSVSSMRSLASSLSAQDELDIAAYITSAK
jgi:mono/diheme cytochrome c family protein